AVLLNAQLRLVGAREGALELVLVEREPEMVDPRQRPLAGLHDDVHRAELELRQPQLEAHRVELRPRHAGLVGGQVLADASVPRDEFEPELADVARLDLAQSARHQVVVEQVHARAWYGGLVRNVSKARWIEWGSITSTSSSRRSTAACRSTASCSVRSAGTASARSRASAARRSGTCRAQAARSACAKRRAAIATSTGIASACTISRSRRRRARSWTNVPTGCGPTARCSRASRRSTPTSPATTQSSSTTPTG